MWWRPKLGLVSLVGPRPGEVADFAQFGHVPELRLTEELPGFRTPARVVGGVDGGDDEEVRRVALLLVAHPVLAAPLRREPAVLVELHRYLVLVLVFAGDGPHEHHVAVGVVPRDRVVELAQAQGVVLIFLRREMIRINTGCFV